GREPVVIVTVKNDCVVWRNARVAKEFFKRLLGDDVAAHLVLKLSLPVESYCARDVAGLVCLGIHIYLDEFDSGNAEVFFYPIGFDQHFRACVVWGSFSCHVFIMVVSRTTGRECVSSYLPYT